MGAQRSFDRVVRMLLCNSGRRGVQPCHWIGRQPRRTTGVEAQFLAREKGGHKFDDRSRPDTQVSGPFMNSQQVDPSERDSLMPKISFPTIPRLVILVLYGPT